MSPFVVAYGAYYLGIEAELCCMGGKVGRCTAQPWSFGQQVPQYFAQGNDTYVFVFHDSI